MRDLHGDALDARVDAVLARGGAHFMGQSPLHQAAEELAKRLDAAGIDYVIAVALSLAIHGFARFTEDIDVIITREGLEKFKSEWLGRGYVNLRQDGRPVRDTVHNVRIDFLVAGDFPGDGRPKPVVIPQPSQASIAGTKYRVLALPRLIELKLASGMTALHRLKDIADVQELIRAVKLPRSIIDELHPYVREKFAELWESAQQEEEF